MSGPIQVLPQGLLGFFQLKNQGRNPVDMPEVLQPVLQLNDWYLETNAIIAPIATAAIANAVRGSTQWTANVPRVPDEMFWYVLNYSIRVGAFSAAESASFAAGWQVPPAGTANVFKVGDSVSSKALQLTGGTDSTIAYAKNFWVPPGGELTILVDENLTGGTIAYTGYIRYVPMPI